MTKQQYVTIKGNKNGLVLKLDDKCAYSDLLAELRQRVSESELEGLTEVQVDLGNRHCDEADEAELRRIIDDSGKLHISNIQSNVLTNAACEQIVLEKQSETFIGIVRSGQVVKADGDLVIIGDVNPNARVVAGGSIFVLGRLKGIAHAGAYGNEDAVIAASWLEATHLLIADQLELMTDELTILSEQPEMECAYLHKDGFIAIDRLQELRNLRPQLSTFKGGI